jgi:hypothetical protein
MLRLSLAAHLFAPHPARSNNWAAGISYSTQGPTSKVSSYGILPHTIYQGALQMARVFTGKVVIPGDKVFDYLQAMEAAEHAREPFRQQLTQLNHEFEHYLLRTVSAKTARKHTATIDLFIDFICWQTDVQSIPEITRGMANSYFRRWYRSKVGAGTDNELKTAIKKFFQFLATEKGITNEAVLKSVQR